MQVVSTCGIEDRHKHRGERNLEKDKTEVVKRNQRKPIDELVGPTGLEVLSRREKRKEKQSSWIPRVWKYSPLWKYSVGLEVLQRNCCVMHNEDTVQVFLRVFFSSYITQTDIIWAYELQFVLMERIVFTNIYFEFKK